MPRNTRSSWGSNKPARRKGYRTLRYWADEHDGRGYMRHTKTIEGSKRDGDHELARIRLAHSEDRPVPTVRECYETWYLPDIEGRVSYSTLKNYTSAWNSKIAPRWADAPVTDIRPLDVQEWLLGFTKSQASTSMKVLSAILDFAVRYEVLDRNPMKVGYRIPEASVRRDKSVYSLNEAVDAFSACEGSFIEPAVLSALFGSCRVGESLSPKACEVVEERASNGLIAARFDLVRQMGNNGRLVNKMKTETSARPIIFVGKVAERMLSIRDAQIREGMTWMCDNGLGEPVIQKTLNDEWKRMASGAGMNPIPFMNLRNSWRTFMRWELGVDDEKLERMMGHKGRSVTAAHYDRPNVQMLIDTVAEAYVRKVVLI